MTGRAPSHERELKIMGWRWQRRQRVGKTRLLIARHRHPARLQ
jgi:hypothetical protein